MNPDIFLKPLPPPPLPGVLTQLDISTFRHNLDILTNYLTIADKKLMHCSCL